MLEYNKYFDVSDVQMPVNATALKYVPSNLNKGTYELSLSLFNACNLNCTFCFQNEKRKCAFFNYDKKYILSIPNKIYDYVSDKIRKNNIRKIYVRIWGGELFNDNLPVEVFATYRTLCKTIYDLFIAEFPNLLIEFNFMTNGIWIKNRQNVISLANELHATIGFSYDPIGRYPNDSYKNIAINNINYVLNELDYVNVATTLTAPNINEIICGTDVFFKNISSRIAIEYNSYIPNLDWKQNLPSDDMLYRLLKYSVDNSMFMVNTILVYTQIALNLIKSKLSICDCKMSVQFSENSLHVDCIEKSSCLDLHHFYGAATDRLTTSNCQDTKAFLAIKKRKCLECCYFNKCPGFCTASILFDGYKEKICIIYKLYKYIEDNHEIIYNKYLDFCKNNILITDMTPKFNICKQ